MGIRDLYRGRSSGQIARPPLTLTQQTRTLATLATDRTASAAVRQNIALNKIELASALAPLKEIHNTPMTGLAKLGEPQAAGTPVPVIKLAPVTKESHERDVKATQRLNQIAKDRRETDEKLHQQGGIPYLHTDPPKVQKIERPQPVPRIVSPPTSVVPPATKPPVTTPPPVKPPTLPPSTKPPVPQPMPETHHQIPPAPAIPPHEQKPIPNFTPPRPPSPPPKKKDGG